MYRVGLTGGIGSGKSTVAGILSGMGAVLVDADAISRKVTEAGGEAIAAIRREFGDDMVLPDGAMNREKMRALAYTEPTARRRLEAIVHPLVGEAVIRHTEAAVASNQPCIVFDIPLLVESGRWRQKVDTVLVVDCLEALQVQRVMRRSGLTRTTIESIMATQASRSHRLRAADAVIFNGDIPLDLLAAEVGQFATGFGLSLEQGPRKTSS